VKNWRLNLFLFLFFILAAIIIGRLFNLQILESKFYKSQVLGQQAGFQEAKGSRGEVFFSSSREDSNGQDIGNIKTLATNQEKWNLFVFPDKIKDKNSFAKILSDSVKKIKKENIISKIENSDSYTLIENNLLIEDIENIKKLKLDGLYLEKVLVRNYPEADFASQVIGFFSGNDLGQYGIEGYYENILKGKTGIREEKRGLDLIDFEDLSYLNGSDIFLTIDYNIQFQAELLLKEAKKNVDIDSGQIIVLEPVTGKILALANFPAFDPNKYFRENNLEIFQNTATQKVFEPGSVLKPFTMAMSLNEGKISPETKFEDKGFVKIGPNTIYNFDRKVYGEQDMSGILEKSINTGAVFLSQLLDRKTFLDYIDKFGFNTKTNIDLQGENYSQNEVLKKSIGTIGISTASFGQGIEMTPLQLARAFCIFANQGKIVKPYIVEKIIHNEEELITQKEVLRTVISPKTASQVTTMLVNVVDRGFGSNAKINGYYLAGKTGTAQIPLKDKNGYDPNKTIQSFIGFGPALNPQFLILVKLDNPKVSASSLSAAPVFKKLAQYIINYFQIPPDY